MALPSRLAQLLLVSAFLTSCSTAGYLSGPDPLVSYSQSTLAVNGREMTVDRFAPRGDGPHPIVLLVHGADGLWLDHFGHPYTGFAQALARSGYLTFMPHYFESTGTASAGPEEIKAHFVTWIRTLEAAIRMTRNDPDARPQAVGLVGISLGASLSLCTAALQPGLGAVVDFFGAFPEPFAGALEGAPENDELRAAFRELAASPEAALSLRSMPPTLIIHGSADTRVPVSEGYRAERILSRHTVPHTLLVFPEQGHFFDRVYMETAQTRTISFLDHFLDAQRFPEGRRACEDSH